MFRIGDASLRWYMRETDGDYHMVLADEHGYTMIAEIPLSDWCHDSPWRALIARDRTSVETS